MENKKPINVYNGLKIKIDKQGHNKIINKTNLISITAFKNSRNITKPFIKPISKII